MAHEFDLVRLRIFREVAVHRSFTAAASVLGLTQPAVSQQVARLERDLGATLLQRSSRAVQLTAPGRALLGHTDAVLARLEDARREVTALARPEGAELAMATFPSAAATIAAPLVASWTARLPGGHVQLTEADPPAALPDLLRGTTDVALAYDYPILRTPHDPRLEWTVVALDPMAVALPANHPLAAANGVPLPDLAALPWVAPHDGGCRDALVLACRRAGFSPRVVSQTNDYTTMLGLVRAGVGVAVVPRLVAAGAVPDGVALRRLDSSPLIRAIATVTRAAGYRPPGVNEMLRTVRDVLPGLARADLPFVAA